MLAISHAQTVLSWRENLMPDEMPPEWMWPLDDELEGWFEEVEAKRKERYGGSGDEDEEGEMVQNDLSKGRRRR